MATDWVEENEWIPLVRWSARVLGVIMAGFPLFMEIAESLESRTPSKPVEPIGMVGAIGLAVCGTYVIAMFLALKWEHAGSLVGGTALAIFFVIRFSSDGFSPQNGVLNPFLLGMWLPVLLYLLCWGLESRDRRRSKAVFRTAG